MESATEPEARPGFASAAESFIRSWAAPLASLVTGRRRHRGPVDPGVAANRRLTATTGIALLVLLAVEGATLLSIRSLLPVHLFVGLMLVPPVMLKLGTTGWRFIRYYTGDRRYRAAGPPPLLLRLAGPVVVLSTVALLGTGVELWLAGTRFGSIWLTAHRASFVLWFGAMSIHVIGHLEEAPSLALQDAANRPALSGRARRTAWVTAALVMGFVLALSTLVWRTPFVIPSGQ